MEHFFKSGICLLVSFALLMGAFVLPSVAEGGQATDNPYSFRIESAGKTRIEAESVDLTNYKRSGDNPTDIVEREDASGGKFLAAATGSVRSGEYFTFNLVLDIDAELVMSAAYAQTEANKNNDMEISRTYMYIVDENRKVGLPSEYMLEAREDITEWETVTYDKITLPKGTHSFQVRVAEKTGKGNPNIDYIEFDVREIVGGIPEEKDDRPYDMHTELQYAYLNDPDVNNIFEYAEGVLELSRPKAVVCDFSEDVGIGEAESYIIQRSATQDFSDPITVEGLTEKKYGFYNLMLGEHFYWRGGTDLETIASSPVHEVTVSSQGPRNCYVEGVTNVRDIGGYSSSLVEGGYIRQGLYYRGADLDEITEDGKKTMTDVLGVLAELDLRDSTLCKGPYIDGVAYTAVSIPSGTETTRFEGFAEEYRQIYAVIAEADEKPVYLHCTAGADRTGIVTFMLLAVCGADIEDIARDYLFTNFSTHGARYKESEFDKWVEKLGKLEGDTLAEQAKNWMLSKGITEEQIEDIRETFVEEYATEGKESGCGSVAGFGSVAIFAVAIGAVVFKKKED